eukprot:1586194-Pleurochrysis_carterae.AAC.5
MRTHAQEDWRSYKLTWSIDKQVKCRTRTQSISPLTLDLPTLSFPWCIARALDKSVCGCISRASMSDPVDPFQYSMQCIAFEGKSGKNVQSITTPKFW